MSSVAEHLVPESIKKLIPYQSARRIGGSGRLWLNANELEIPIQYDEQPAVFNRYPDFLPQDTAAAFQAYCGVKAPVVAVRGADEAIDLLVRTFCQPGRDKIVTCSPTYAMYQFCAQALAIDVLDVPLLGDDFHLNVAGIAAAAKEANLIFLCSPNNPTGNPVPRDDLIAVLEQTRQEALVILDEAYIEFDNSGSAASLIEQYPNLVVIRTLSKAFGLAAVRCGFILADESVMNFVAKLIPPYPMPDSSASIVLKALSHRGQEKVSQMTETLTATREWFIEQISGLKGIVRVYPSATNFVLLRTVEGAELFNFLKEAGIVTRNQGHEPALRYCVRITIGSRESMAEVVTALKQFAGQL